MNNVDKFLHSYSGRDLLSKHHLDEYGLWKVRGEDPNCDLGGYHHSPELGIFEGKLRDVIAYAVRLPGWYAWGSGGSIESYLPRNIRKITSESVAELDAKAEKKAKIRAERDKLNQMLEELEDDD